MNEFTSQAHEDALRAVTAMETGLCGDCFGGTTPDEWADIVCTCPK